jgi:hypothetical protein
MPFHPHNMVIKEACQAASRNDGYDAHSKPYGQSKSKNRKDESKYIPDHRPAQP